MPLCTLHLVSLHQSPNPQQAFLSALKSSNVTPLVVSRVIRWIILPSTYSTEHLLARNIEWDFLLILPSTDTLPLSVQNLVENHWHITAGVPSRLVQDFAAKNDKLLRPSRDIIPKLRGALEDQRTTTSAQDLELSAELKAWIRAFNAGSSSEANGAVSMFNLLSFKEEMKSSYLEYGKAFASSIGKNHGGNAKIVGGVTDVNGVQRGKNESDGKGWDEVALAHYPSILHFAEMLADVEYQAVNHKYRTPSLRDTAILMTSEVGVGEEIRKAKL